MNLIKKIFLVFTAVLLLLPSSVSFSHIFTGHDHTICDNYAEKHYHNKALDCELHKFHKNSALTINFSAFEPVIIQVTQEGIFDYYQFLNEYEPLHFDLRGPPFFA
ncbi:hypothetical protein [Gramella sp. MAR_2010_147]|uniref:hypothetical protein n=1 Tax=Gramella sp. MAR_2010_147 TaxID=1250205 RepID=UPI00087B9BD9|nr:hypothetical protein [Gramella sp. MAR_2010_147]SDR83368.1 hypothetical protein SAMN04488553_0814 [Gramella sp. MAR_2010_147]